MTETNTTADTTDTRWAPLPATLTGATVAAPAPVADDGIVRLGGQAPLFTAAIADDGTVRLGGQAPLFQPMAIADAGLVRLGGQSPIF